MDTFPLFAHSNAHWESNKLFSSGFLVTEKSARHLLGRRLLPFSIIILLTDRCDSVYDDFRACGDSNFLQSKETLVGCLLANVNLLYLSHDIM